MKIPQASDLIVFSRMVGAALLIGGYLLGGLYIGSSLTRKGHPGWTLPLCILGGLLCALFAGYREIKNVLALIRKTKGKKGGR